MAASEHGTRPHPHPHVPHEPQHGCGPSDPDHNPHQPHPGHQGHGHHDGPGHEPRQYCFLFDEKRYEYPQDGITPQQIRDIVGGIGGGTAVALVNEDGSQVALQEGQRIPLESCACFRHLPRFTRGRSRIDAELAMLRREFPSLIVGEDRQHIIIPGFLLPPGLFTQATCALLVMVPPTYPTAPPDNFFMAWGLALKSGQALQNHSGPVQLAGGQWGTFSHHLAAGAWSPGPDPESGDNLRSYLATVRARLQEGA